MRGGRGETQSGQRSSVEQPPTVTACHIRCSPYEVRARTQLPYEVRARTQLPYEVCARLKFTRHVYDRVRDRLRLPVRQLAGGGLHALRHTRRHRDARPRLLGDLADLLALLRVT